jgi:hypothetical protein
LIDEYGQLALCDYGTSYYSTSNESWQRHWRIVDEVMRLLLAGFATFDLCRAEYPALYPKSGVEEMIQDYHYVYGALLGQARRRATGGGCEQTSVSLYLMHMRLFVEFQMHFLSRAG